MCYLWSARILNARAKSTAIGVILDISVKYNFVKFFQIERVPPPNVSADLEVEQQSMEIHLRNLCTTLYNTLEALSVSFIIKIVAS